MLLNVGNGRHFTSPEAEPEYSGFTSWLLPQAVAPVSENDK
jgi:hypothetical protein